MMILACPSFIFIPSCINVSFKCQLPWLVCSAGCHTSCAAGSFKKLKKKGQGHTHINIYIPWYQYVVGPSQDPRSYCLIRIPGIIRLSTVPDGTQQYSQTVRRRCKKYCILITSYRYDRTTVRPYIQTHRYSTGTGTVYIPVCDRNFPTISPWLRDALAKKKIQLFCPDYPFCGPDWAFGRMVFCNKPPFYN